MNIRGHKKRYLKKVVWANETNICQFMKKTLYLNLATGLEVMCRKLTITKNKAIELLL